MLKKIDAEEIKLRATALGAELCGIAPVERFAGAPTGFHPTDVMEGCRSVVMVATRFPSGVFSSPSSAAYTFAIFKAAEQVDAITFHLADELDRLGGLSVAVPSRDPYDYWDDERRHGQGILSLKHAAVQAGLGRMGKNTLLVNDRLGNMLCLGAVLVDRDLAGDAPADYETCEANCRACLDVCPAQALDGTTISQRKCRSVCGKSTDGGGFVYACHKCRQICPHRLGIM
jgi:epoxyqueuosine reductase